MVFINYQVRQVAPGQSKVVSTGAAPEDSRAGGASERPEARRKGRRGRQDMAWPRRGTRTRAS